MRDRAWRRHISEKIVIRRLKRMVSYQRGSSWRYRDVNDIKHHYPILKDYIGTPTLFMYKTHTTDRWDTNHKVKYSPNKSKFYWRGGSKNNNTREKEKIEFIRIKKEYGIN